VIKKEPDFLISKKNNTNP